MVLWFNGILDYSKYHNINIPKYKLKICKGEYKIKEDCFSIKINFCNGDF